MKKYIAPIVRNINLDTESMLAASPDGTPNSSGGFGGGSEAGGGDSNRRQSIWGED